MKHAGKIWFLSGFAFVSMFGWFAFPRLTYKTIDQPVQFNHKLHTGETVGHQCSDCHELRDDGTFAGIPSLEKCATCHSSRIGSSAAESLLVVDYVSTQREIPWQVYARQPANVYFSHVPHIKTAGIPCERCHGPQGSSEQLRPFEVNRITSYSKDIWGSSILRWKQHEWDGMRMVDCSDCHRKNGVQESCIDCHK